MTEKTKNKTHYKKPIKEIAPLVFLDVETTGLSAQDGDRICEIAILRKEKSGRIVRWHSLINPKRPISPGAAAVNKITEEMLREAPEFSKVAKKVLKLIEGGAMVCHNARFDLSFVSMEMAFCDLAMPVLPIVDTLRLARQHFSFPSNSLGNIAGFLNIKTPGKHRAMADVDTTYRIFRHFWGELNKKGIKRLEEIAFNHV